MKTAGSHVERGCREPEVYAAPERPGAGIFAC